MANLAELVIDQYGPLSYKATFQNNSQDLLARTWVSEEHERRLRAYTLLTAYLKNMSRFLLQSETKQRDRREYGDCMMIVETIVAAILGEETTISVQDAGETETREPGDPQDGDDPGDNEPEEVPVNPDADLIQEWFDGWEHDERPLLAFTEGETDAVGLGDGVYEVTWDGTKKRPRVVVYEPGFYFPVLDTMEQANNDFPTRVHVAWDFERWEMNAQGARVQNKYVRRITWELVPATPYRLPWNSETANVTCLKTDATWAWDDLGDHRSDDFDWSKAVFAQVIGDDGVEIDVDHMNLGIDFLPVVHLPNTIARKEHFGTSSLALILQIIDDLQGGDTDLALASRLVGTPPLSSKDGFKKATITKADGTRIEQVVQAWGPGQLFDGEVNLIDTSKALDALLKYTEFLMQRLTTNVQLSDAALGRVDPSQVDAGIILSLSFGPMQRMVQKMRMSRSEKYPLLLKFVLRFAVKYELVKGLSKPAELPEVDLVFGRFMPQDRQGTITAVTTLLEKKAISRLTAVKMLIEDAGLPIEDAAAEVERIEHEDFAGAVLLADAGDDVNTAREYLGLDPLDEEEEEPEQPPVGQLPPIPLPGAGGAPQPPGTVPGEQPPEEES